MGIQSFLRRKVVWIICIRKQGNLVLGSYLSYYAPWIVSGEHIVAALSVRLFVCPFIHSSVLLLSKLYIFPSNYWLEFNETLWEASLTKGDVHIMIIITIILCSGLSNCPFNFYIIWHRRIIVWAISEQSMTWIQCNFMESFTNKRRCSGSMILYRVIALLI